MKNYERIAMGAATALLSVTMLAAPVLAEVGGTITKNTDAPASQSAPVDENAKQESNYMLFAGEVTSVTKTDDVYTIAIGGMEDGVIFHTQSGRFVIDQASNKLVSVEDIKTGMTLTGIVPANSSMTLSLPPQTGSAIGFVIHSEAGSMDMDIYNEELVNSKNTLKINSVEGTNLIAANGNKMVLTEDSLKGAELLVLYTASTKSIPAQTTPETVIVLTSAEDLAAADKQDQATQPEAPTQEPKAVHDLLVPLRSSLEGKGYKITWNGMDQPITIAGDTYIYTIHIGSTTYTRDMIATSSESKIETFQLQTAPVLENNQTTMVEQAFIEALTK